LIWMVARWWILPTGRGRPCPVKDLARFVADVSVAVAAGAFRYRRCRSKKARRILVMIKDVIMRGIWPNMPVSSPLGLLSGFTLELIVEEGAPESMFTQPKTERVRQFLKRYNDRYRL
jgi:hypothetical protein